MSKEKNKGHKEKKKPKMNKDHKITNQPNTVGNAIVQDHHKHDH